MWTTENLRDSQRVAAYVLAGSISAVTAGLGAELLSTGSAVIPAARELANKGAGNAAAQFSKLKYLGNGTWQTYQGLIYGQGSAQGNRVLHVLEHAVPNANKANHTVFNVAREKILPLVDEAWSMRGGVTPIVQ